MFRDELLVSGSVLGNFHAGNALKQKNLVFQGVKLSCMSEETIYNSPSPVDFSEMLLMVQKSCTTWDA